jgi:hypothetical protein
MKRHIKAFLITAAILAAFVGLVLTAAFYPAFMINGILITLTIAVCVALYMIVLLLLKKDDNEKI